MNDAITSLPNNDDDISEVDLDLDYYVIRITSYDKFTFDELESFVREVINPSTYVIGVEHVPREHFHIVLSLSNILYDENYLRKVFKEFLTPLWVDPETSKLPRGFGNKQYNLQICDDLDKAVSYAVKLGEYRFAGFDENYVQLRKSESFEKKKPSDFKAEYRTLCDQFQTTDMTVHQFMIDFVKLKAKYGQQVIIHTAYSYALSNEILRDPKVAENEVEKYLYNL